MRSPQQHVLKDRKDDHYATPAEAVYALLAAEDVPNVIWECACGDGAIVSVLRASGRMVLATDLVDYGLANSASRVDFLMEPRVPAGTQCIITNPPNKLATAFAEHALKLCPRVMLLQPVQWLGSEKRTRIFDNGALVRVHVFKRRLPMMHRFGWGGPRNSSQIYYAWYVWNRDHRGPTILDRIDWRDTTAVTPARIQEIAS
jgi:hypothetical protein